MYLSTSCKRILSALLLLTVLATAAACRTALPTDVPQGYKEAASEALDFAFYFKDTWELDRTDGMLSIKYNVGNNVSKQYATVSAQAFSLQDSEMGANDYWDSYKGQMQSAYGSMITFQNEKLETSLGGVVANRNRYTIVMEEIPFLFEQVICVRYGNVYLVTLTAPESRYQDVVDGFDAVITHFRFLS